MKRNIHTRRKYTESRACKITRDQTTNWNKIAKVARRIAAASKPRLDIDIGPQDHGVLYGGGGAGEIKAHPLFKK